MTTIGIGPVIAVRRFHRRQSVHARQADVHDHHFRRLGLSGGDAVFGARGHAHLLTGLAEQALSPQQMLSSSSTIRTRLINSR